MDQDDVGVAQISHPLYERTRTIVVAVVPLVAYGSTAVRVVHTQAHPIILYQLPPPCILHTVHVRLLRSVLSVIPQFVGLGRHKVLKRRIGVTQY